MHILVVCDPELGIVIDMVRHVADHAGCTMTHVATGDDAINQPLPDVFVLLADIPKIRVEALLDWLHSDDGPRSIPPVIAIHMVSGQPTAPLARADAVVEGGANIRRIANVLRPFLDSDHIARLDAWPLLHSLEPD